MDYLIADGMVVRREQQRHYAEKIAYLPGSSFPFDSSYAIADETISREEVGLPSSGFVFCCFNNSYKIPPANSHRGPSAPRAHERAPRNLSRARTLVLRGVLRFK